MWCTLRLTIYEKKTRIDIQSIWESGWFLKNYSAKNVFIWGFSFGDRWGAMYDERQVSLVLRIQINFLNMCAMATGCWLDEY